MAELNLKQIVDKLNTEFSKDTRKLVFWYDEKGEFAEDIDGIELANAKVYKLEQGNQFYTKYFLEKVDTITNYLVYAPCLTNSTHKSSKDIFLIEILYLQIIETLRPFFICKKFNMLFYDWFIFFLNSQINRQSS